MKLACNSWSYHRTFAAGRMDQIAWLGECAKRKLDGVELLGVHFPSTERAYLAKLKQTCAEHGLEIAMVSANGHLTVADDAQRSAEVEAIRQWVEVAAFFEAPRVRFFCGSGDELKVGGAAHYAKVLAAVREVAAVGERRGIVMALENHGNMTADQLLALHRDVGNAFLKFTLDTGNFPPAGQAVPGTYTSIAQCAPLAAIVHAKFYNVTPSGAERDFDWQKIHALLVQAGFDGFLSVEYEGEDPDELALMARIIKFLKTLR